MRNGRDVSLILTFEERFIDPSLPTGLWWCANLDDVKAVGINAVCKSMYAPWDRLNECMDFINQFHYVFVATPNNNERAEIAGELQKRVEIPLLIADKAAFRGNDSVSSLLQNAGQKAVESLLFNAIEIPRQGLLDLSQVDVEEPIKANRTMSGITPLDFCVGGYRGGELSVWTGRRGEGKSTIIGQMLVEAVNQNKIACAYSGELPARQFKKFVLPQIAGPANLDPVPDQRTGRTEYMPKKGVMEYINKWLEGRFLLTDIKQEKAHDEDNILSLFEYAYRKYGCSVFLVDNIMTAQLKSEAEVGHFGAQKEFTRRLSVFAKKNDVHVHMVAHPRKTGAGGLSADDVAGANEIGNLADNIFSVERATPEDDCSCRIRILKVRENGNREVVPLMFDEKSHRFYDIGGNPNKRYSWEAAKDGHG